MTTTFCDPEFPTTLFYSIYFIRLLTEKSILCPNDIISGGIFSIIDLEMWEDFHLLWSELKIKIKIHTHHPDTGTLIEGKIIPEWDSLKNFFTKIGGIIKPYIKIVGWDIILTDDSFVVIEGNNGPDLYFQGADYPLAKNPEVLKFLKHFKLRK